MSEEAKLWADDRGMLYIEASSKNNIGVDQVFQSLVSQLLNKIKFNKIDPSTHV